MGAGNIREACAAASMKRRNYDYVTISTRQASSFNCSMFADSHVSLCQRTSATLRAALDEPVILPEHPEKCKAISCLQTSTR